ncbi:hypothetical protein EVB91_184 [Rhizobium phage RHph_I1_18]|nr:hypothetical protein EVB91_184 [Rhizobium phage RHph_I1_18]
MYAQIAAEYMHAWCRMKWPENGTDKIAGTKMASTMCRGEMIDCFDIISSGTHKYIPANKLTADLERPQGAGVYAFFKFSDGSYLLMTCDGPLAYWAGEMTDKAEWAQ